VLVFLGVFAVSCGVAGGLFLATKNDDTDVATTTDADASPRTALQNVAATTETEAPSSVPVASVDDAPNPVESVAPSTSESTPEVTGGEVPDGVVPESMATIRDGQIFFEGAVPTAQDAERIVALAAEILGPDNVINNYVIDPRAGDPSEGNITVEDTINFATDSAALDASAEPLLNQGLALLNLRPDMTVEIVGHTDSRGSDESNAQLALARGESVKAWFVERGVAANRLTARGAGELEPLASNETSEGRALNRRIQFFLENVLG
jgi:OmpA-OmpF porin, OOP family